jgi:hypothetical protein
MITLSFLLLLLAVIVFLLAALNVPSSRVSLIALGLTFLAASFLVGSVR